MKKLIARHFAGVGFGLAGLIFLGVVVLVVSTLGEFTNSQRVVMNTLAAERSLEETQVLLTDAETSQRGYIITGSEAYLQPYQAAVAPGGAQDHIRQLHQLMGNLPGLSQKLDDLAALVSAKLAELASTIQVRRTQGFEAASQIVATDVGKITMDEIRGLLSELETDEQNLLQSQSRAADEAARKVTLALEGGGLAMVLLALAAYWGLTREVVQRRRAQQALQELNDGLEQRVQVRSAELARRDREYRNLFESSPEGIFVNLNGRVALANRALVQMLRFASAEMLVGRPILDLFAPAYHAIIQERLRILLEEKKTVPMIEEKMLRSDGTTVEVEVIAATIEYEGQVGVQVFARDITERKQAEQEVARQLARLRALREIDESIIGTTDLRLALRTIVDKVVEQLGVDAVDILLLNPHTQMLEFGMGKGFQTQEIERGQMRLGQGYAGQAALAQRMIAIPDLAADQGEFGRAPLLAGEGFVSYFAVPLIAKGSVIGVLDIFQRTRLEPDPKWYEYMTALAGQAAIAIENSQLFSGLRRANLNLMLAYDTTIEGWSRALDRRDKETEDHTRRVTELTLRMARAAGMSEAELVHVRRGALLHDIGKMGIPDTILLKEGPLSEEEQALMSQHPVYAFELLSPIEYLRPALDIPYCHHEKWDGSGYPRHLKGEQIPLAARLFAVVDVWDALHNDRYYRKAWDEDKVLEYIQSLAGTQFDPRAVELFMQVMKD
jgi:PAS domain S-box-containing protein/putative nucleotidyltransferase with HDIG domain